MNNIEYFCCFLSDDGTECDRGLDFTVTWGGSPDDYTHTCSFHLGDMVPDDMPSTVYPGPLE